MSEFLMPAVEETPPQDVDAAADAHSIITLLGMVEGDVLESLEMHGSMSLTQLMQEQAWSTAMLLMAVGALIRAGLVSGNLQRIWIPNAQDSSMADDLMVWD